MKLKEYHNPAAPHSHKWNQITITQQKKGNPSQEIYTGKLYLSLEYKLDLNQICRLVTKANSQIKINSRKVATFNISITTQNIDRSFWLRYKYMFFKVYQLEH